jgi:aspartate/glutamate racemase
MSCATNLLKADKAARANGIPFKARYTGRSAQDLGRIPAQVKRNRIAVLAPDAPSGQAYYSVLMANKLKADLRVVSIAPRVLGNQMNTSSEVEYDLARAIKQAHDQGYRNLSVACNTLQLWKDKALQFTPCIAHNMRIITTFEAMRNKFPDPATRPVWLGTTVTCRSIDPNDFPTLLSQKLPEAQRLVQEIIWRTKAVTGAATATSGLNHQDMANPEILKYKVAQLIKVLKRNNLNHIVMGCTELPIAFGYAGDHGLRLEDPAQAVAEEAKRYASHRTQGYQ